MIEVRAAPQEHFEWMTGHTGYPCSRPEFRAIEAVDDAGRILGMVGYDHWTPGSVQMHVAVEYPCRRLLRAAFYYPFEELGRPLVLGLIPSHNLPACRLATKLGFREAHRIRDGWARGDDLVLFEMRREECRWLDAARKAA